MSNIVLCIQIPFSSNAHNI